MKRHILPIAVMALFLASCTQSVDTQTQDSLQQKQDQHPRLEELIPNLTSEQESQIHALFEESRVVLDSLKMEQEQVRDSISHYNDLFGDHTAQLIPFYQKEADIQFEINLHFYQNKLRVDSLLTPEQFEEMISKMKQDREHNRGKHDGHHEKHHDHDHHGDHHGGHHHHHE